MSFTDDLLEIWLMRDEFIHEAGLTAQEVERIAELRAALDQLQDLLDHPPAKGATLMNSRVYGLGRWSIGRLACGKMCVGAGTNVFVGMGSGSLGSLVGLGT